ncbi:C-type lectin-like [Trinorchestia longiramus]|nr:C-type lectin-like [Trinorchestia longiramus]
MSCAADIKSLGGGCIRDVIPGRILYIADATVTSVSSAAVASGHHSSDLLTGVIKRSATQVKNSIRQSVGGCPQHFTSLGGLCLKVPSIAPPVPFAPVHYSPTFTPTSNVPPATSYNWTQARAICRSYDGDLAVVPEFHDLTKIFRSLNTGSGEGFWLGAKRKSVTEGETPDQPEARVKLKWITGEFSEFDSELKQKMSFKSPFVTVSQNVLFNSADGVTVIPYTDSQECLLLRTAHSLVLEVTDCGALHKPLCQFIPTL